MIETQKLYIKEISSASVNATVFGVPKMFIPRWWKWDDAYKDKENYFNPKSWTYMYDHSPLAKTLDKYIDYTKLNLAVTQVELPEVVRLIITAVDVMTSRPLIFDNTSTHTTSWRVQATQYTDFLG